MKIDKPKRLTKRRTLVILLGFSTLLLVGWTVKGLRPDPASNRKTMRVERKDIVQSLQLSGKVFPEQTMVITAQESGRIVALKVKEGDKVKSGDLLFSMRLEAGGQTELMDLRSRVKSLEYEVAAASRLMKDKNLVRDLIGVAQVAKEESELEKLRIDLAAARERLAVVENNLGLGRASKSVKPKGDDGIVFVQSPIDGIVTLVDKRPGDFVLGGAGGGTSEIGGTNERMVMVVADMNKLQVRTRVMEADLRYVKQGLPVKVRLDAYPDTSYEGKVEQIGGQGRAETKAGYTYFDVYVGIEQRDGRLLPEMNATVDLIFDQQNQTLTLPVSGVLILPGQSFVRVVDPKQKRGFRYQQVETGVVNATDVEIVAGLKEGDQVSEIDFSDPEILRMADARQKRDPATVEKL